LACAALQAALPGGWIRGSFFLLKGVFVMKHVIRELKSFALDESGATAIEYGLLAALVALGIVVGATALGTELGLFFGRIATRLSTAA
jgi:pilus assembly protein Flp/PilA